MLLCNAKDYVIDFFFFNETGNTEN
jgi:hypothetical protein